MTIADPFTWSLFPDGLDQIRNQAHPQVADAIMAIETYLLPGGGLSSGFLPTTGGALSGPLVLPDGTAAAPSLRFAGSPATGIFRSASDGTNGSLGFSTGASARAVITGPTGGMQFRLSASFNFGWSSGDPSSTTLDTFMARSASADLVFSTSNTARWSMTAAGHLVASTDNTVDIGQVGANRPRN